MSAKFLWFGVGLIVLTGCTFPVRQQVDNMICDRSSLTFDQDDMKDAKPEDKKGGKGAEEARRSDILPLGLLLTAAQDDKKPKIDMLERLKIPNDIPASDAPLVYLDPKKAPKDAIKLIVEKYFPDIPRVMRDPDFPNGPDGQPLTLAELQKIAVTNSPLLRQAASDIQAARGNAIQVAAYPNPTIGYESSSEGPSGGPTVGLNVSQTIKTMGKLTVAQAAALENLKSVEFAYRRAETDLMYTVRTFFFQVAVAQENLKAARGLVELTDEVYRVMVDQLKGGEVATYEPLQLRVFAEQARAGLITARNARLLAWKQLAAALGTPFMPPTAVAGKVNRGVARLDYEKALAHVLSKHTDVLTTAAAIGQARYNLRLAQITPYPDITITGGIINDLTPPGPSRVTANVGVSLPIPVFDRNKGGIIQAQAALLRASEEPHRVQADLTSRFSEAYRRYEENRALMDLYTKQILPKQVQAFRAAVRRHYGGDIGGVAYNDLVASEQNLVAVIPAYITVLGAQWQAVVDVANFLQTDQFFKMVDDVAAEPGLDLEQLLKLPCHHPCAPLAPEATREGFSWPPAVSALGLPIPESEAVRLELPLPAMPDRPNLIPTMPVAAPVTMVVPANAGVALPPMPPVPAAFTVPATIAVPLATPRETTSRASYNAAERN